MNQSQLSTKLAFLNDRARDQKKFLAWTNNNRSYTIYVLVSRNGQFEIVQPTEWNSNGGKPETLSINDILGFNLDSVINLPSYR